MVQKGLRKRLILPGGQYPDHALHSFAGPAPPLPFHAIAVEPVIRFCSTQKDGRETVISVIYKKRRHSFISIKLHIFQSFQMLILHIFSIFYQAGNQPYSSQDPSTLVPHAAIAHTPFPSAQDDVQSPSTSHRQTTKKNHGLPWFFGLVSRVDLFLSGEAGLFEVHASGVNGMYPAFLMAILPSEDGDGDPGG